MLNSLQIQQYQKTVFTQILSSQFVYSCINEKCELKKQTLIIENKKMKKLYYLYLFLLTKKKPYVKKQYLVAKNFNKKNSLTKPKTKSVTWKVEIKNSKFYQIFSQMLFQIIPFQTNSEKKILKLKQSNLDLVLQYAPLTTTTFGLKAKNNYLSDIPLTWRLKWTKNTSTFQKIFILKHFRILNESFEFRRLENATL